MVTLILLILVVALLAFSLGQLFALQRQATQVSHFAFIAAFYALNEAKGLKNSTVIQRIVEKYHPIKQSEELTKATKELEEMLQESVMDFPEPRKEKQKREEYEETFDPDSLV